MALRVVHQILPQQNAVDRTARQFYLLTRQQHLQFARAPVRIALPQLYHAPFQLRHGASRTLLGSPTALRDPGQPRFSISPPPQIPRRARDPKLLT